MLRRVIIVPSTSIYNIDAEYALHKTQLAFNVVRELNVHGGNGVIFATISNCFSSYYQAKTDFCL